MIDSIFYPTELFIMDNSQYFVRETSHGTVLKKQEIP